MTPRGLTRVSDVRADAAEFDRILMPLERLSGERLTEPGRTEAREAFAANEHGFRHCVNTAHRRGNNPVAFLLYLLRSGDHLLSAPRPRDPFACAKCGKAFTSTLDRREHEGACDAA